MNAKKLLWSSAMILLTTVATAQVKMTDTFCPSAGDISTEVQFNPLSNSKNSFQIDGLRLRYFLSDENAVRVNLGFGINNKKDYEKKAQTDNAEKNEYYKTTNVNWSIDLGYEKHHSMSPRLDVYSGFEAGIQKTSLEEPVRENYSYVKESSLKSSTFGWQASIFTGADFYVYRGLYLGSELGLRFTQSKKGETTQKIEKEKTKYKEPDTNTTLGFYVSPSIRLGWTF